MSIDSIREISADSPASTAGVRRRWRISGGEAGVGMAAVLQRRADAPAGLLHEVLAIMVFASAPCASTSASRSGSRVGAARGRARLRRRGGRVARMWTDAQLDWLREADRAGPQCSDRIRCPRAGGRDGRRLRVRRRDRSMAGSRCRARSAVDRVGPVVAWSEDVLRPPRGSRVLARSSLGRRRSPSTAISGSSFIRR